MAYQGIKRDRSRSVDQTIWYWGLKNFPTCNLGILLQHGLVFPDLGVPNMCTLKWSERSVMDMNYTSLVLEHTCKCAVGFLA